MKVNWQEYFKEFCAVHGLHPVLYRQDKETGKGGWLLFPDGWRYGREVAGPEFPPPEDKKEHLNLIKDYWSIRYRVVKEAFRAKCDDVRGLINMQAGRSVRLVLPRSVRSQDEDGNLTGVRIESNPVDFVDLLREVEELKDELLSCKEAVRDVSLPDDAPVTDFSPATVLDTLEAIERSVQ